MSDGQSREGKIGQIKASIDQINKDRIGLLYFVTMKREEQGDTMSEEECCVLAQLLRDHVVQQNEVARLEHGAIAKVDESDIVRDDTETLKWMDLTFRSIQDTYTPVIEKLKDMKSDDKGRSIESGPK